MINKIKNYFILRKARNRYILLGKMIDSIDKAFKKNNIPKEQVEVFWYNFIYFPISRRNFIKEIKKYGI